MKIKYVRTSDEVPKLEVREKGEWVDLALAEELWLSEREFKIVSLGIRMQLPKGFEAWIVPRSSTFKKYGILQGNSVGIIDSTYCGKDDIWGFTAYATKAVMIPKGTRLCQFRILPSMRASADDKIQWLNTSGVEFIEEEYLNDSIESRGGFGSTGD